MEELNSLPYLDAVVKENLRVNNVVSGAIRQALKDDVIPLSVPLVDRKGVWRESITYVVYCDPRQKHRVN